MCKGTVDVEEGVRFAEKGALELPAWLTSTDSVKDLHSARKFSSWSGHVPTPEIKQLTELQWTCRECLNFFCTKSLFPMQVNGMRRTCDSWQETAEQNEGITQSEVTSLFLSTWAAQKAPQGVSSLVAAAWGTCWEVFRYFQVPVLPTLQWGAPYPPSCQHRLFVQVDVHPLEREQTGQQSKKHCPVTLKLYCVFVLCKSGGGWFK